MPPEQQKTTDDPYISLLKATMKKIQALAEFEHQYSRTASISRNGEEEEEEEEFCL